MKTFCDVFLDMFPLGVVSNLLNFNFKEQIIYKMLKVLDMEVLWAL